MFTASVQRLYQIYGNAPFKIHKLVLREFWRRFHPGARCAGSRHGREETLRLLIALGEVYIPHKFDPRLRRRKFVNKRRTRCTRPCFACAAPDGLHRHHLIWLSRGGLNCKTNQVNLCDRCHARIHPWMYSK